MTEHMKEVQDQMRAGGPHVIELHRENADFFHTMVVAFVNNLVQRKCEKVFLQVEEGTISFVTDGPNYSTCHFTPGPARPEVNDAAPDHTEGCNTK